MLCFKDFPPQLTGKEKKDVIVMDCADTFDGRAIEDAKRKRRRVRPSGLGGHCTFFRDGQPGDK